MTSKEHKKHSEVTRPSLGNAARNEWAVLGTECSVIKTLADNVIEGLSPLYKCAYLDAQHFNAGDEALLPGRLATGAVTEYTNKVNYRQLNYTKQFNKFGLRLMFAEADLVLMNGNHGEAKAQVVVIDPLKKSSLKKRVPQLTNVELILLTDRSVEVFDFIKESVPKWQTVPVYLLNETDKIVDFFKAQLIKSRPRLNGLVLAGGKSVRMGHDKSVIDWHGKKQRYYLADLLKYHCTDVYISCRPGQQDEMDAGYKTIADTFTGLGPYGAILSAFRQEPDAAWLVIACDLPLMDINTLEYLATNRNFSALATTFESPHDGLPEPLVTIWEPKSYPVLLSFLSQGYTCPRKVLINSEIHILQAPVPGALVNVNTPEEKEKVKNILQRKLVEHHEE
jgi:molybdopterin-guanine dinucleotide biosynthesis protein A